MGHTIANQTIEAQIHCFYYKGITGLTYGNGLSLSQGYDNQYRISSIVVGSLINLTYGYDANGNITSIGDAVNPPGGEPLGNPGTYTYQQGANRLLHIEGTPATDFGYDANGNTISENNRTYTYNLSDRLIRVEENGTTLGEYVYNGVGQRIIKVAQTGTSIFHYDLSGHLIAETNQAGQVLAEYIYLGDKLLAMIRPGESVYYYHNDHLGTPQILTDDTGTVSWKAVYTPFGEAEITVAIVENNIRFPGQYYDQETGLHYNYFRDYKPDIGRYLTPDPIGLEGGINLYVYAQNNPINFIDPMGLSSCEDNCFKFLKRCYLLAGIAGLTGGAVCNAICISLTKNPVFCKVVCAGTGAYITVQLQFVCLRAYKKCIRDCGEKENGCEEKISQD